MTSSWCRLPHEVSLFNIEGGEFRPVGNDGDEVKSIHWAPELVLEPSRVRTSSAGSILSKSATNYWDDSSYECDCGVAGCHCYEVGTNRPKWIR